MFHLLEKLRSQSKSRRTFIAFAGALFFTGCIFVFWLGSRQAVPVNTVADSKVEANTPTDTLIKNVQDVWASIQGVSTDLKEVVKKADFSPTVEYVQSTSSVNTQ